jgi:PAS domain S-box-containing protein
MTRRAPSLARSEARCRAILDAIGEAVVLMDDERILDANQRFAHLLGYKLDEILDLPPSSWLVEESADAGKAPQLRRKDGTLVPVRMEVKPLEYEAGGARVVVVHQINDQYPNEQQILALNAQLAEKVRDFETLIEVTPVGIAVAEDPQCRVIRLNPAFASILGCSPGVNGSKTGPLADTLPFEIWKDGHRVEGPDLPMQEAAREGRVILDYEEDIVRADGQVIHGLVQAAPLFAVDGSVRGSIGVLLDITERKRAEEALASRERELRALFEHAGDGHSQADAQTGRYLRVNRKFCELTGYSEAELLGMTFYDMTHHDDRALNQEWVNRAAAGEIDEYALEKRYIRKDGSVIWVHVSVGFIRDAGGAASQTVASVRDISERKRIEAERDQAALELQLQTARLQAVLEQMPAGVIISEAPSGKLLLANTQVERIWRRPFIAGRRIDTSDYPGFHPDGSAYTAVQWPLERAIRLGETVSREEIDIIRGDGSAATILSSAAPIRDATGSIVAGVAVVADITELKLARVQLQYTNEQLQQFAYAASHDLNEPLRNIVAFTQLFQRRFGEALDADGREMVTLIADSGRRMQVLLTDLLSYTRAVAPDTAQSKVETCDSRQAVRDVLDLLDTQLFEAGADVIVSDLPAVRARRTHLMQVFQNLVSNAIKYRDSGRRLRIEIRAASGRGEWIFQVEDNGIGVPEPWREQIFGVFHRLHGRDIPGTGIGLAICRRIVTHYGGRIWMEPSPNGGSCFCFSLPGAVEPQSISTS